MNVAELEQDLESVVKAIEQSIANHNVLLGQKQGLEHVINKMKAVTPVVEAVAQTVEGVAEAVTPETTTP